MKKWFVGVALLLFSMGCSLKSEIKDLKPKENDYLLSTITYPGPTVADGVTQLVFTVHLQNGDGTFIVGLQPQYNVISGGAAVTLPCTVTNGMGNATCAMTATTPGFRTVKIMNIPPFNLQKALEFLPYVPLKNVMGIVSADESMGTTPSGHKVSGSVGAFEGPSVTTAPGGWKIYNNIQGVKSSN